MGFACHDAREVPFPETPADVVYCRLLLAHLNRPMDVLAGWATQLAPDGLPLGVQLVGAPLAETRLLEAARWIEAMVGLGVAPPEP